LPERFVTEAKGLADLTGWKLSDILVRMAQNGQPLQ